MLTIPHKCKTKGCPNTFIQYRSFEKYCVDCATAVGLAKVAKIKRVELVKEKRADKVKLEKMKKRSDWIKECQVVANKYARMRDIHAGHGCISCGAPYRGAYGGAFDGGHLRSVGSAPHKRFYLPQICLQCVRCNRHLGGNAIEFRKGLVLRRGLAFVEKLESDQDAAKWSIEYLQRFKRIIGKRAKRFEQLIANSS